MERAAQAAVVFMGIVAAAFALDATSEISAPMALALALGVVLAPVSDFWQRIGFSSVAGALSSLVLALAFVGLVALLMQPVAAQLIDEAPKVWRDLQGLIGTIRELIRGLGELTREVADTVVAAPAVAAPAAPAEPAPAPAMPLPAISQALMLAPAILGQVLTFAGTLFFFVLSRDDIYDFAARRLSDPSRRAVTAQRLRAAERLVSRYFLAVSAVNAGLGLATFALLALIGLPAASLWGTLAFLLNFIVYLGPGTLVVGLLFAGVAAFDGAMVLAPAAIFLALNAIESQFVTPLFVSRQTEMNPLVVFVAILFGIWIWGPIGGVVAIPLMLWVRVLGFGTANGAAD